jgi:hypothetical protein
MIRKDLSLHEEESEMMKYSNMKLLAVIALLAAALGISAYARRIGTGSVQDQHVTIKVNQKAPASFDAELSAGKVVGMTAVYQDESKLALKQQDKPTCATSCPAGQRLSCWEDHEQMMSICVCVSGGKAASAVVSLGK